MSQEEKPKKLSDILFIVAVVAVILVPIVAIIGVSIKGNKEDQPKSPVSLVEARARLAESSADLMKATLNVYYVNYKEYPVTDTALSEDIVNNPHLYSENAAASIQSVRTTDLQNFNYSVRGDYQAYKFTYTDPLKKETVTVEGDYQNSYH